MDVRLVKLDSRILTARMLSKHLKEFGAIASVGKEIYIVT